MQIKRAGEKPESHGAVRIIYHRGGMPVVDPPTPKGRLARRFRMFPPKSEQVMGEILAAFERLDVYFQRQVVLAGYIGDFYCAEKKLLVELDGPHHRGNEERDRKRDWHLSRKGIRTVRYSVERLHYPVSIILDVAARLGLAEEVSRLDLSEYNMPIDGYYRKIAENRRKIDASAANTA